MRSGTTRALFLAMALGSGGDAFAQTVSVDAAAAARRQTIDGFGTCLSGTEGQEEWWQDLYYDDLGASILRVDIVPRFKAPYSDFSYNSPWFHSSPALPGPDGNNVRTYTGAADYGRLWSGRRAPIAVMGPDIDRNVQLFDYEDAAPKTQASVARAGVARKGALGDFKLTASMWSPAPWLKLSAGGTIGGQSGILPVNGTPWPFIWGGNFSGGMLDTSDTPRTEFDDSSVGGSGPTSALTQFARGLAAYLRGLQQKTGERFYAISIQNELNFETFYNSCTYPLSAGYIKALKAARAELDEYEDLRDIRIMGPEDLLGGDGYGMWQYGGGGNVTHKNLQYLANIAADPAAASAVDFFCVHGYAPDGVSSSGSDPKQWAWWVDGWTSSPAAGLPATAKGFAAYGKKSWMTETSGEATAWLSPASGFPGNGAFSIAVKIHQALTIGRESAWIYWQLTDGAAAGDQTLTDATARGASPKYVAMKHFAKYIRPGAVRVGANVTGSTTLLASAYVHDASGALTVVLVNTAPAEASAEVRLPRAPAGITSFGAYTSRSGSYFVASELTPAGGALQVSVPGYGVVTLHGKGTPAELVDGGAPTDGGQPSSGGAANGGATGTGGAASSGGALVSSGGASGGRSSGGAPSAGGSTSTGVGGRAAGGSTGAPADGGATPPATDGSGCGCRVAARRSGTLAILGVVAAVFVASRRRRG